MDCGHFPSRDISMSRRDGAHSYAELLKHALKSMGEPLLTSALYERFLAVADQPDQQQLVALHEAVGVLPAAHNALARFLFLFLYDVAGHANANQMNASQLTVMLAPLV